MPELVLPFDLASVSQARSWVGGHLTSWSESGLSRAVLVTSEIVANGIIHARTELSLNLDVEGDCARLEVTDGSKEAPMAKQYGQDAATGRGLKLIGRLSEEWGARIFPGGKTVWAVIRDLPWDTAEPEGLPDIDLEQIPPPPRPASAMAVQLLDIPVSLLTEAQQHNDALLRELVFVTGSSHLSARLEALAREVTEHFASAGDVSGTIESAVAREQTSISLTFNLSPRGWASMLDMSSLLDEADQYCERMELLTLASSPAIKRFRQWYREQIQAQTTGRPATPWAG